MSIKVKKILYLILVILFYIAGLILLMSRQLNDLFAIGLSNTIIVWLGILGIFSMLFAMICMIRIVVIMFQTNKEMKISEQDERNIMIRGKAAQLTIVILSLLMLILEGILIVMSESTAAILVAITFMLGMIVYVFLIGHFDKRY